jgi:RNA polymerase sigma factor (sigma-70 family)
MPVRSTTGEAIVINTETSTSRTVGELVAAAQQRDSGAFEELIHRYHRYVWAVVHSFRLSDADGHDAVQNTWLRLVENLDRIREPERLGGWLATTASRECLALMRRRSRELGDTEDQLSDRPDQLFPSPEQQAIDQLMATQLSEQMAALPARGRALLGDLTRDAVPYAELARRTGMPIGSIGPTRGRYLRKLRDLMEQAGLGPDSWR